MMWLIPVALVSAAAAGFLGWYWWMNHNSRTQQAPSIPASLPTAAVLTPKEAAVLVGDSISVEFVVGSMERSDEQVLLYEEAPKANDLTFRLALPQQFVANMQNRGSRWPEALRGARLRVHGTVYRDGNFAEILVSDLDQFDKLLYPERGESKKREHATRDDGEQPVGPTPDKPRTPENKDGKELSDSVEDAAKSILAPFLGKDAPKK
jgi:hypothetical protein